MVAEGGRGALARAQRSRARLSWIGKGSSRQPRPDVVQVLGLVPGEKPGGAALDICVYVCTRGRRTRQPPARPTRLATAAPPGCQRRREGKAMLPSVCKGAAEAMTAGSENPPAPADKRRLALHNRKA